MESTNRFYFILKSIGESHANEGDKFTSRSHGFNSVSIIISKPNNSKQLFFKEFNFFSYVYI